MLRETKTAQQSFYSGLYEKIPENHLLKRIDKAVNFSFINELLESSYDLTGLSLLDFSQYGSYSLDLSYNQISDISELEKLGLKNINVSLSYNKLDLSDAKTKQVIEKLKADGCTVSTNNQNYEGVIFGFNSTNIMMHKSPQNGSTTSRYDLRVYPYAALSDITFSVDDKSVVTNFSKRDSYIFLSPSDSEGETILRAYYKGEETTNIKVFVVDSANPVAPTTSVSYYSGQLHISCTDMYNCKSVQYRKQGSSDWISVTQWPYNISVSEIGTYEVSYVTYNNYISKISTVTFSEKNSLFAAAQNDGTFQIIGYNPVSIREKITVPSDIDGRLVTAISNSISNENSITEVIIPNTVTAIAENAFSYLYNLKKLTVPASMSEIHDNSLPNVSGVTLYCQKNSAVLQCFQIKNGWYTPVPSPELADINEDDAVNIKDIVRMKKYLADNQITVDILCGDLNFDTKINVQDLVALKKRLLSVK